MVLYKQSRLNICVFWRGGEKAHISLSYSIRLVNNSIVPQNAKKQNAETCTYNDDLLK